MEALLQIEASILLWIQNYLRNDFTDPIVKFITHLGDHGILWIALLAVLLCIPKTRKAALLGAVSLLLTFCITNLCLKPLIARVRPYEVIEGLSRIIEKQSDKSFPSGHTANSMAVGVSLWISSRNYEKFVDKDFFFSKKFGWLVLVLSILIGLSRLYVGVHYPTDVIGGACVAVFAANLVFMFYRCMFERKNLTKRSNEN